ncbi:unnamed protein product [Nyctereutes procyonoides]|uniref:(raccoon dog) hypothetical protein n=1 Tax=Nyctereutes procyonoides TaxID=34880 RepID=A0A811ZLN3_NYCPR|nr:unnamed protein product [Nyctereutes procyonoides]
MGLSCPSSSSRDHFSHSRRSLLTGQKMGLQPFPQSSRAGTFSFIWSSLVVFPSFRFFHRFFSEYALSSELLIVGQTPSDRQIGPGTQAPISTLKTTHPPLGGRRPGPALPSPTSALPHRLCLPWTPSTPVPHPPLWLQPEPPPSRGNRWELEDALSAGSGRRAPPGVRGAEGRRPVRASGVQGSRVGVRTPPQGAGAQSRPGSLPGCGAARGGGPRRSPDVQGSAAGPCAERRPLARGRRTGAGVGASRGGGGAGVPEPRPAAWPRSCAPWPVGGEAGERPRVLPPGVPRVTAAAAILPHTDSPPPAPADSGVRRHCARGGASR